MACCRTVLDPGRGARPAARRARSDRRGGRLRSRNCSKSASGKARATPAAEQVDAQVAKLTADWARAMEALGLDVKGLWLVDFDNGNGCYCWRWPETELAYFHGYDEGFSGRVRIQ